MFQVVVLVTGQEPDEAEASDFGQHDGMSSPAQHGFVQSAGQSVFGQMPFSAQHGLEESSGQVFVTASLSAVWALIMLACSAAIA